MNLDIYNERILENGIWYRLKDYCSKENRSFEELIDAIRKKPTHTIRIVELFDQLNRTRDSQKRLARQDRDNKNKGKLYTYYSESGEPTATYILIHKPKNRLMNQKYDSWALELNKLHSIPIEVFGIDKTKEEVLLQGERLVINLKEKRESFSDKYKSIVELAFGNLNSRMYIYDYLEEFPVDKHEALKEYYRIQDLLYKKIEVTVAQAHGIKYCRIVSLPHNGHLAPSKPDDIRRHFLWHCSKDLLRHLCRCLCEGLFEKKQYSRDNKDGVRSGIYIANRCERSYQFGLLDSVVFTEYYRYNLRGVCYPDLVFLEQSSPNNEIYRSYLSSFKSHFTRKNYPDTNGLVHIEDPEELLYDLEEMLESKAFNDDTYRVQKSQDEEEYKLMVENLKEKELTEKLQSVKHIITTQQKWQ